MAVSRSAYAICCVWLDVCLSVAYAAPLVAPITSVVFELPSSSMQLFLCQIPTIRGMRSLNILGLGLAVAFVAFVTAGCLYDGASLFKTSCSMPEGTRGILSCWVAERMSCLCAVQQHLKQAQSSTHTLLHRGSLITGTRRAQDTHNHALQPCTAGQKLDRSTIDHSVPKGEKTDVVVFKVRLF